jgi:8-oxo-dGTP pyrophosphatase MutT (NUDIX family)
MVLDSACLQSLVRTAKISESPAPSKVDATCVFLLLFGEESDRCILAIQKSDSQGYPWRNQVALPGGHIDPADSSPAEAVFRELEEELQIPPGQVDLIGSLGHFQTINQKVIEAFVGVWNGEGPVRYDPAEIARVLEIPLARLVDTHHRRNFHGRVPDVRELRYPFENVEIWGATARILHFFIELLYPTYRPAPDPAKSE